MRVDEEEPGKVRVKRVLWDGTVQDDVYKPQDIKVRVVSDVFGFSWSKLPLDRQH
jgi:hypothetical protein